MVMLIYSISGDHQEHGYIDTEMIQC